MTIHNQSSFAPKVYHNAGLVTTATLESTASGKKLIGIVRLAGDKSNLIDAAALFKDYESNPEEVEASLRNWFFKFLPGTVNAIGYLAAAGVVQIVVRGLPVSSKLPPSPVNGFVEEADLEMPLSHLVGLFGAALNLRGFAYDSENEGRILRGIVAVEAHKNDASSQGFANDLGWHQDNIDKPIDGTFDYHRGNVGFMNHYQAFVAIRPDYRVPMETVLLDDVIVDLKQQFGPEIIEALSAPEFSVRNPDSHDNLVEVKNVSVLVQDCCGRFHARFHADNVKGCTDRAKAAITSMTSVLNTTTAIGVIVSAPGDLLIYRNTQVLHRRKRYPAKMDGTDRYYVRTYLAPDAAIVRNAIAPNSRIVG